METRIRKCRGPTVTAFQTEPYNNRIMKQHFWPNGIACITTKNSNNIDLSYYIRHKVWFWNMQVRFISSHFSPYIWIKRIWTIYLTAEKRVWLWFTCEGCIIIKLYSFRHSLNKSFYSFILDIQVLKCLDSSGYYWISYTL